MNRIKFVFILFLITLTSLLTSCFNNDASKVKIVDMQGNSAKINKIVPQFNQEQLENQKIAFKNKEDSENLEVNRFRQDYNDVKANNNSNNLKNTRQINKNTDLNIDTSANNDSLMFPISNTNKYPNDIFADRITNYNYIQETPKQNNNYRNDKIDNRNLTYKNEIIEGDIVDNKKVETNKKITTTESSKPTKKVEIKKNSTFKKRCQY